MVYALDTDTVSYHVRREAGVVPRLQSSALAAFEELTAACGHLDFDAECADHAARIRLELEAAGTPIGLADLLIAATARRHGCILVTHNTREFSRVPDLPIEDWY